ncbi:MAG: HDOD domain-containing protein [Steroidobacteraceae bacterium]
MEWIVLTGVALLAAGGGYAIWRGSRREAAGDDAVVREATARFEALRKEDPSVTHEQAQIEDEAPVDASELLARLFALNLGLENANDVRTPVHTAIEEATSATLEDLANHPRHLPRRPSLLPQVLQAVNDEGASLRGIARLISQDPTLTGNLLRIANSPAYRTQPAPIESIERAVSVLGTHGIRSTIAAAVMQPVLSSGGAFGNLPELIWDHGLRVASAAEAHAMLVGNDDPFAAQLIGLLDGLASIAIFRIARDEFTEHPDVGPSPRLLARLIDQYAGPTAARIAASWELSRRIVEALDEQSLAAGAAAPRRSPLGQALYFGRVAGALALLIEAGSITPEEARAMLPDGKRHAMQVDRIWERMLRASKATKDASTLTKD